jgi:hypothetical protein
MSAGAADTEPQHIDSAHAAPRIAVQPHPSLPWLLMPDGVPVQVLIDTAPVRVPNTQPWFCGVVSQRGNLMPVFDVGFWAGYPPVRGGRMHLVAVGVGVGAFAVVCAVAPALVLPEARADRAVDAGLLTPFLGAGYASAVGTAHAFEMELWLAAASMQVPAAGSIGGAH